MQRKKRVSSEDKMKILREHLENNVPISDISEKYGISVNVIYSWKKALFENGAVIFNKQSDKELKKNEAKINMLEEKLQNKDSLISEIIEDNIRLKKKLSGEN